MGRWKPGAGERLREAALALYLERGFEQTTVTDIAERAGVTARTFFRYFADKREVLFADSAEIEKGMLTVLDEMPATATALDAVTAVLDAVADMVGDDHESARLRQTVITANADLRERQVSKLAILSTALADRLRQRGTGDTEADLAAEMSVSVFRVAFSRWVDAGGDQDFRVVIHDTLDRLRTLAAAG